MAGVKGGIEKSVELIHKSDVYFDFFEPDIIKQQLSPRFVRKLRHGNVYIYLQQLLLYDNNRWFKVNMQDISEVRTVTVSNQLILRVGLFDLVLCCKEETQLSAISNFLELSMSYFKERQHTKVRVKTISDGGHFYRKVIVKMPMDYTKIPT